MKEYRIRFKPTNNVFALPEEEIRRILKEDRGFNYEILDKDFVVEPQEAFSITTTFEQVVEEETVRGFEDYTADELREFCKANDLKVSGNKSELLKRCLEFTKQLAEAQVVEEEV